MLGQLFVQECERCWRYQTKLARQRRGYRLTVPPTIKRVVKTLGDRAVELNQPAAFVVSAFAYYYADIERNTSFRYINLKMENR
jgi:hypothetical protein